MTESVSHQEVAVSLSIDEESPYEYRTSGMDSAVLHGPEYEPRQESPKSTTRVVDGGTLLEKESIHRRKSFTRKSSDYLTYIVEDTWFIEVFSWLFSFGGFVAVVTVLWRFDNQSLPQFPYGITVGTLIALFTTLSVTALMVPVSQGISQLKWLHYAGIIEKISDIDIYDQASRGIWGCFLLILSRNGTIPTLGSFLTILVLAANAVTQQAISYPPHSVPDVNGTAVVPVMEFYSSFDKHLEESMGFFTADRAAQAAFLSGIFHDPRSDVPFQSPHCSTGNCTWSEYSTLAICSSVEDVSTSIKTYYVNKTDDSLKDKPCPEQLLVIELPDVTKFYGTPLFTHDIWSFKPVGVAAPRRSEVVKSMMFSHLQNSSIADFYVVSNLFESNGGDSISAPCKPPFKPPNSRGVEINLHFCVQTLVTEVRNGFATTSVHGRPVTIFDYPKGAWYYSSGKNATVMLLNSQKRFGFYSTAQQALLGVSREYFNGTWLEEGETVDSDTGAIGIRPVVKLFGPKGRFELDPTIADTSDYMQIFSKWSRNLAMIMSNSMRSQANDSPVEGVALMIRTKIHVSWPWITLLAFLEVGSLVFLLLVVWMNRRRGTKLWRSSNIALLQAVDPVARPAASCGIYNNTDMARNASKTRFRLRRDEKVWKFVDW